MLREKSCGALVVRRDEEDGKQYLLMIRHKLGGHRSFPKGHMESGEDEQTTALREIREEIGVNAELIPGFRAVEVYPLPNKPGTTKEVVYFLANYSGQELRHQKEELKAACLLPYKDAWKRLTFEEAKRILAEADGFLKK